MPKEKPLYRDTLERFRKRADELYPKKTTYNQKEAARLLGRSSSYLSSRGIKGIITCEQLAWFFS